MKFVRIIFQFVVGLVFGLLAAMSLSPLLASLPAEIGTASGFGVVVIVCLAAALAPNVRRALGRSFLLLGVAVFVLPISTMLLSGVVTYETVEAAGSAEKELSAAAGILAGGAMTAFAGFIGFVLGTILLVIGLVLSLGGRREVIVVENRDK